MALFYPPTRNKHKRSPNTRVLINKVDFAFSSIPGHSAIAQKSQQCTTREEKPAHDINLRLGWLMTETFKLLESKFQKVPCLIGFAAFHP